MNQTRIQVYVVDDEPAICTAYTRLIKALDMDARAFSSVEEFLKADFVTAPACVVADVQMPGTSGLELPALLRAAGHHLPIIFVSATPPDAVRDLALQKGGAAFFSKPVDGRTLAEAIWCLTRPGGVDAPQFGSTTEKDGIG